MRKADMDEIDVSSSIVARRKALGLTQAQLAQLAGVNRGTVSALENLAETRGVTVKTLLAALGVLGLTLHVEPARRTP